MPLRGVELDAACDGSGVAGGRSLQDDVAPRRLVYGGVPRDDRAAIPVGCRGLVKRAASEADAASGCAFCGRGDLSDAWDQLPMLPLGRADRRIDRRTVTVRPLLTTPRHTLPTSGRRRRRVSALCWLPSTNGLSFSARIAR